jgi:hypothetical protein
MPTPTTQAEFVEAFAAELEARNSGTPAAAAAAPATTPAPATPAPTDTTASETADEELETPAASGAESDDDDEGTSTEETGDDESTAADGATDGDDGTGTPAASTDGEDDHEPAPGDEAKELAAFQSVLKKHGLKTTVDDLPAEMRPIVTAKLKDLNAAFTRAQMEATQFRRERATFEADRRYREQNPELALAEVFAKNPDLIDKVQAQLDKLEDPDKKRLFESDVRDTKKKSADAVEAEMTEYERRLSRGDEIENYTRRACSRLNLPFEIVENAIALALDEKPADRKDLTSEELDAIIGRQQRVIKRHTTAVVRETKKKGIQQRTADRRATTPAARPGSGTATPTPTPAAPPKTQAEFIAHMVAKNGR